MENRSSLCKINRAILSSVTVVCAIELCGLRLDKSCIGLLCETPFMQETLIGASVHAMTSSQGLRTLVPLFLLFSTHLLTSALSVGEGVEEFQFARGISHFRYRIHELVSYMSSEIKQAVDRV